jgi:DNA topoisomerase-1
MRQITVMKINEDQLNAPNNCPICGSELEERIGKYGKFLGCTKFPECRYTYDLTGDITKIKCPDCGKNLRFRSSNYGRFLSCSSYPDCKFAFNPNFKDHPNIFCPISNEKLEMQMIENKKFISCTGQPDCNFKIEWINEQKSIDQKQIFPKCPKCNNELVKRKGKYGNFLSCITYPQCKFAFNPELQNQEQLLCLNAIRN